jgi:hypothetical protein
MLEFQNQTSFLTREKQGTNFVNAWATGPVAIHAFIMTAPRSDVRTVSDGGWFVLGSVRMSVCSDIVSSRALGLPVTVKRTFMRRVGP